jgi:uncharacterized cupredoxin-like copper-binding protein
LCRQLAVAYPLRSSLVVGSLVSPDKSTTLAVTDDAGKLVYVCTVPGHAAAGMKGT